MITVKINSMHLKSNEKTVLFREFVRKAFMQKRNECSQLFPLPLAIRKEICILIRVSLPISPRPPPSGLFARFHQEKYSAYLAFKGVYNFSNPALELFDRSSLNNQVGLCDVGFMFLAWFYYCTFIFLWPWCSFFLFYSLCVFYTPPSILHGTRRHKTMDT